MRRFLLPFLLFALPLTQARAQIVYSRAWIVDFYGQSTPSNPPTNFGRVYFDTTTQTMKCRTSAGADCWGGGSSNPAFSAITSGTNTTAAMVVGAGASLSSTPQFNIGAVGTAGVLGLVGSTSGTATLTAPAVAGTSTNPIAISNVLNIADGATATPGYSFTSQPGMGMWRVGASQLALNAGASVPTFGLDSNGLRMGNNVFFQFQNQGNAFGGTVDTGFYRSAAKTLRATSGAAANSTGSWEMSSLRIGGTKFTTNAGCGESAGANVGGATAGKITTVGSTSCTTIVTMGDTDTASTGWACTAHDLTTSADYNNPRVSSTTTTATIVTGTIVSGDVIEFSCVGY